MAVVTRISPAAPPCPPGEEQQDYGEPDEREREEPVRQRTDREDHRQHDEHREEPRRSMHQRPRRSVRRVLHSIWPLKKRSTWRQRCPMIPCTPSPHSPLTGLMPRCCRCPWWRGWGASAHRSARAKASARAAIQARWRRCTLHERVSTSRQFLVYGPDLRLRGAICELAEATKKNLLTLLGQRDAWTTPIIINAQFPQANLPELPRAALTFSQTGFGLKIQLDLTIAADVRQPEIRRELLRAILVERMYRRQPALPAGTSYVSPPDWLLDGISARDSNSDFAEALQVLAGPLAANKIIPLEEFLRQRPALLEAPARILYRAYSSALCELLVRTNDGRVRLNRLIENLPSYYRSRRGFSRPISGSFCFER